VKWNLRPMQFEQVKAPEMAPWKGSEQTWQNGGSMRSAPASQVVQR